MKNLHSLVFFGTHELALPALQKLVELELTPQLIVTRPKAGLPQDDEAPDPHPVRDWAREHGIEVVRSRRATEPALLERIAALEPDLLLVVDFGRPLPEELLGVASRGAIEVHPSLLPKLRGEHALRSALALGDKKSGVSVIEVNEEPWGGPILLQEELEIGERENFGELLPRAQELSGELLAKILDKLDRRKTKPKGRAQNDRIATTTPRFGGRHRRAPWTLEAAQVYDRLRAYTPPCLLGYCKYRPVEIVSGMPMEWVQAPYGATGTYLGMRLGKLAVLCKGATVFGIDRLRRPGGRLQGASGFVRSEGLQVGDIFV